MRDIDSNSVCPPVRHVPVFKKQQTRRKSDGAKRDSRGRNVLGAKRPGGETSRRRNVLVAKRPGGETSCYPLRYYMTLDLHATKKLKRHAHWKPEVIFTQP